MATGVEELVDMLYVMIDEAKNAPFHSDRCVVDRERALDLIEEIKAQFPVEFSEARKLTDTRTDYLATAKREAETIRKQAEDKARHMLSEDERLSRAKQKAEEMLRLAEERSKELRRSANEYCEDALRRTEEAVSEAFDEVKRSRARFRAAVSGSGQPTQGRVFDAEATK